MDARPYVLAIIIQVVYTGMFVILKAAYNQGLNTFVFVFYSQAAASLLLLPVAVLRGRKNVPSMSLKLLVKLFLCALIGNTFSINMLNLALRMEVVKLRSSSAIAKVSGIALCLAGVFVIAFFVGPPLSPVNHHRAYHKGRASSDATEHVTWIKGTFLKLLGDVAWSLWIVFQSALLKEYPNKMLVTASQSLFSTLQTFIVAAVAERGMSRWKLKLDIALVAVLYHGFLVIGALNYLQVWCMEMRGPVFLAIWFPLSFVFTIFASWERLSMLEGGILLVGGLYSVLWAKNKESTVQPRGEDAQDDRGRKERQENMGREEHDQETPVHAVE